ncbi:PLP-dependent cysteine synthase family protein [Sorangium sp. So ce1389]|uniref:PLP-dependent cysteine synthase family protein n=1 Tax=Sorangium sp. So ce1389 TaxID=3133336 RepID=UPI003F61C70C
MPQRGDAPRTAGDALFTLPAGVAWPSHTQTVLDHVGNTPLCKIADQRFGARPGVELWAKLEGKNPGGSVKDRAAAMMIMHGIATGKLKPGQTILDSTSGNTGIALAMMGTSLGHRVQLCMSAGVRVEVKQILFAYGADVVFTDPAAGSDGAILKAQEIYQASPERYFVPDQYNNPANVWAHYLSTAPEIWQQTEGRVTHLVAAIGTGGTVMGTGWGLRERNPGVRIVAVEPDEADHGLSGMRHIPSTMRPGIYCATGFDQLIRVSTDSAYDMARKLARQQGLLVGASSAAVLTAAQEVAAGLEDGVVVAICPDSGDRYLSSNLFDRGTEGGR